MTDSYTATLNGWYDMVLEYYENNGSNRVTFDLNSVVLPIELTHFSGNLQNEQTHLYWTTTLHSNTEEFIVEKSTDGRLFRTAGQVKATSGITTATGIQYAFTDPVAVSGNQYYRLKMTDQNGIVKYSEIINIRNSTGDNLRVYPTVLHAGNKLLLETNNRLENVTVTITDMMGRAIMQRHMPVLANGQTTPVELPGSLVKGMYMVQVKNQTSVLLNQKIIVQ